MDDYADVHDPDAPWLAGGDLDWRSLDEAPPGPKRALTQDLCLPEDGGTWTRAEFYAARA